MRTPGILIFGMVMAPCGWVLNLVTTVAPNWRTLQDFPNLPPDRVIEQGIWDICIASTATERQQCGQEDTTYFGNDIIEISQGLMLGSLIVTLIGICVAIPGVRCWTERAPNWAVCTCAGFLIFISGVLTLIAVSWYTHIIDEITTATPLLGVRAGYCLVLGFIGGIFEVLGGFVMTLGCCRCCGGKNRGERPIEEVLGPRSQPKREPRRVDVEPQLVSSVLITYLPSTNNLGSSLHSSALLGFSLQSPHNPTRTDPGYLLFMSQKKYIYQLSSNNSFLISKLAHLGPTRKSS
uniref:Claudin 23.1 n=1 Tax=Cyprinodon variegatus TaxID=28743 RepID=A0A3Q2CY48_CYPVA